MNFKNILLIILILLISIIIYYIQFLNKIFYRYQENLPFYINKNLNQSIFEYLLTKPSRKVLLLSGIYKSGKTFTLLNYYKNNLKNKIFSIYFDFSNILNKDDIFNYIQLSFIRSIQQNNLTDLYLNNNFFNNFLIILNNLKNNSNEIINLFKFFENLNQIPIIFINDISKIFDFYPELINSFISYISTRKLYLQNIPIIIEISNSLIKTLNLPITFEILEIPLIDNDFINFLKNLNIFSKNELKIINQKIGFNIGEINDIFEKLKLNYNLNNIINEKIFNFKNDFKFLNISLNFCDLKKSFYFNNDLLNNLNPLIKNGYLYINDDLTLKFSNNLIYNSICSK